MKQDPETLVRLRRMILDGALAPGQRIPEALVAEMLGLSRTPVRQALPVLEKEGLLVRVGARGYAVRAFSITDIAQGVELRGALEGFAARVLAERGVPASTLALLDELLAEGDVIFAKRHLVETDEELYGAMNDRLHTAIVQAANVPLINELLERVNRVPFTSPRTIAFDKLNLAQMYEDLWYAHRQHHGMVTALRFGEGARVEALLREHVNTQKHSMNLRRELKPGAPRGK